jgi:hypothetical protein
MLGAYHATWSDGNEDEIVDEVSNLGTVFMAMEQAKPGEANSLIVGDFNLVPSILPSSYLMILSLLFSMRVTS